MPRRPSRAARRNVHLCSFTAREVEIGGLVLNNGITHASLYSMVEIIIISQSEFTLRNDEDTAIERWVSIIPERGGAINCSEWPTASERHTSDF